MLITRDVEIAGLPAVQARALMRTIRDYAVSLGEITHLLDSSADAARAVVRRLEEQGYLCRVEPFALSNVVYDPDEVPPGGTYEDLEYWGTTITGNGLAKARIGKPMPRQKAAQLLDELLDRAATVNADDASLFSVERLELFGSFADPDRQEVGDVDARVVFDRRVDGDEFMRRASAAAAAAEANRASRWLLARPEPAPTCRDRSGVDQLCNGPPRVTPSRVQGTPLQQPS
jgi:predicted nucleotidyltransferase